MSKIAKCSIAAVVVTYNRKELLRKCLQALLSQTRLPEEIIVIDNASTDGTNQMIPKEFPQATYVRLPKNLGGAGGFHEGIKLAYKKGHDWIWVMDDDTLPMPDALLHLIQSPLFEDLDTGFMCSHVIWEDGQPHIMNIPQVAPLVIKKGQRVPFNSYLTKEMAILISSCSFVSVLIRRDAISSVGLPIKEFFVWGDDVEYTSRLAGKFAGYYIPRSEVIHKTISNQGTNIVTMPSEKLYYYFYEVRNRLYLAKKRGISRFLYTVFYSLRQSLKRPNNKLRVFLITVKGIMAAILFNPRIEYVNSRCVE